MKTLTAKKYLSKTASDDSFPRVYFPGVYQFENGLCLVCSSFDRDWFINDLDELENVDDLMYVGIEDFTAKELKDSWVDSLDIAEGYYECLPKIKQLLKK